MSSYQLLSTKDYNPLKIGTRGILLQYIMLLLIFITPLIINLFYSDAIPTYTILILFFGLILIISLIAFRIKINRNKLQIIGFITFNTDGIQKKIKDLSSSCNYEELEKIELEKHLPAVSSIDSLTGCKTYKVTIISKNKPQEKLIVSDLSTDNKKVSIVKALRFIEKKYSIKIKINI